MLGELCTFLLLQQTNVNYIIKQHAVGCADQSGAQLDAQIKVGHQFCVGMCICTNFWPTPAPPDSHTSLSFFLFRCTTRCSRSCSPAPCSCNHNRTRGNRTYFQHWLRRFPDLCPTSTQVDQGFRVTPCKANAQRGAAAVRLRCSGVCRLHARCRAKAVRKVRGSCGGRTSPCK